MTGPNKCSSNVVSNVVTVTVFGNFYEEKNVADICGEASVLPPALTTLHHIAIRFVEKSFQ